MGATIELFLLTVLCASVGTVQGACTQVPNDDMVEYSCVGGQLSDLDYLPASTGKIRISKMPIPMITRDTFSKFGSDLWVLGCSYCGIRDIEPGAFQYLQNLQQLSLDNNQLSTLRDSWFRGLDSLTYLDLNYNVIESIDDGVFQTLPGLVDLRLSGNRLECLNLEALSKLSQLKRMFLTENSQFKCPNALSTYFENHGVHFEKDPSWNRITEDLIPARLPYDDYHRDTTTEQNTPLPAYRERLHPTPPPPEPSTPSYLSQRVQTTEEVIYRPAFQPPDWQATTPSSPVTDVYDEYYEEEDDEETRPPYVPPQTIAPVETVTIQQPDLRETTLRSWPRIPEPPNGLYPPYANEDGDYRQTFYATEASLFPLAPVQDRTPPFAESDVGQTPRLTANDWHQQPDRYQPPEVLPPMPSAEDENQVVAAPEPEIPTLVQPATSDNVYQAPYYEQAVTVHSSVHVAAATDAPTTTELGCPMPNSSATVQRSLEVVVLSMVITVLAGRVFVEGF